MDKRQIMFFYKGKYGVYYPINMRNISYIPNQSQKFHLAMNVIENLGPHVLLENLIDQV